jgi:hypothetical protein
MYNHPVELEKYQGTIRQLASELGNLRYDVLVEFIDCLTDEIYGQADADKQKGRKKLAQALRAAAYNLSLSKKELEEAWKISEPFMKIK